MGKYLAKKFLLGIASVFIIVTVVFILIRMLPTDCFFTDYQLERLSEEQLEDILDKQGLNDPIIVQLKNYFVRIFTGDWGISRKVDVGVPVLQLVADRMGISIKLGVISMAISVFLGICLGAFQTIFKDKLGDHIGTAYVIIVNAVPTIVSFSLILFFGANVLHLPMIYSAKVHPITSLILPVVCLSLTGTAGYSIWCRRYMIDEVNKDYIKLAKMKGLSTTKVIFSHVLRNAIVPLVQYLPTGLLLTIGGSLLVESFFSIPGMGPLLTDAIKQYDVDVVQGLILIYSSLSVGGIVLGDILMSLVDPRISLTKKEGTR